MQSLSVPILVLATACARLPHGSPEVGNTPLGCYRATPALTYSASGAHERGDSAWAVLELVADGKIRRPSLQRQPAIDDLLHWKLTNDTLRLIVSYAGVG